MAWTMAKGAQTIGPRTPEALQVFQDELDALRNTVHNSLGERDTLYVTRLLWLARGLECLGRGLILLGAWFWPAWLTGVMSLSAAHLIETMELGHNLMHGQFDWMKDPRFSATGYRWNFACEPRDWCEFHNLTHHHYANVQGKDRDYGSLRLNVDKPWRRGHLLQPVLALLSALWFEWGVAVHNLQLERRRTDPVGARARIQRLWPRTRARMGYTVRREYLLWPALGAIIGAAGSLLGGLRAPHQAAWCAIALLTGHAAAGVVRNVWAYFIIACGHFTTEAHTFAEADLADENKGQWYVRQILSAANFHAGIVLQVLSGHASHQIEHHIYPDMPSNRLAEIAPAVRDICRRHGVPYNTGSLPRQTATVILRILRHSLPGGWHDLTRLGMPPACAQNHASDDGTLAAPGEAQLECPGT
jgi:linoleoyl-CoA desaturase